MGTPSIRRRRPPDSLPVDSPEALRSTWDRLDAWVRSRDFEGFDPYDSLTAKRVPRFLTATPRRRQLLVQAGKWSPVNLRPLIGVAPHRNCKALALVSSAYAMLHRLEPDSARASLAASLLSELEARGTIGRDTIAWGYEFDVQTRWSFYPRGTPNIIVTTFVGNAFLDWYEITGDPALLETAAAAVRYLNKDLLGSGEDAYYSYVPRNRVLVHNANVLGCALTSRVARLTEDSELRAVARGAAEASLQAQGANGLWPYGREPGLQWVDGFHTAYVLDGLCELRAACPDETLRDALRAGFKAYSSLLFGRQGEPRYTPGSLYPIDIHSAATAVDVLSRRKESGADGLTLARRVCGWTLKNMWDPRGYFYFQRHRVSVNRIPYVRWSQAHMLRALGSLLGAVQAGAAQGSVRDDVGSYGQAGSTPPSRDSHPHA